MPTENRSSNTEMVSVPRERAELLINLLAEVARTAHWLADNSEDCGDEGIDCQRVDFEALSDALDKCEELQELPDSPYVRDGWLRAADELRALLAQPAQQHQGEPVAYQFQGRDGKWYGFTNERHYQNTLADGTWPIRPLYTHPAPAVQQEPVALPARKSEPTEESDVFTDAENSGFNTCLDEIAKLGPLYTHADPNVRWKAVADEQMQVIAGLRAQLAEAHALLADAQLSVYSDCGDAENPERAKHAVELADRIDAALSASAEPSAPVEPLYPKCSVLKDANVRYSNSTAPVERDERAEFETEFKRIGRPLTRADYHPEAYGNAFDDGAWAGWQARAALDRKP